MAFNYYSTPDQAKEPVTYLLHFDRALGGRAWHYCGKTTNLERRVMLHRTGQSQAKIMLAAYKARIDFTIARTWPGLERERQLKNTHNLAKYCPICRANKLAAQLLPVPLAAIRATQESLQAILPM